jgi:hypothetical protein
MAETSTNSSSSTTIQLMRQHVPWVVALLAVFASFKKTNPLWNFAPVLLAYFAGVSSSPVTKLLLKFFRGGSSSIESQAPKSLPNLLQAQVATPTHVNGFSAAALAGKPMEDVTVITANEEERIRAFRATVDREDWNYLDTKDGTRRYKLIKEGESLHLCKGTTVINADLELIMGMMSFGNFEEMLPAVDKMNIERRIVEQFDEGRGIFYSAFKMPMIFWNRDFVFRGINVILPGRIGVILSWSVERPDVPTRENDHLVRGNIRQHGYIFKEIQPGQVKVDFIAHADPCGVLPTWATNIVSKEQADNVSRLRDYIESAQAAKMAAENGDGVHTSPASLTSATSVPHGARGGRDVGCSPSCFAFAAQRQRRKK